MPWFLSNYLVTYARLYILNILLYHTGAVIYIYSVRRTTPYSASKAISQDTSRA